MGRMMLLTMVLFGMMIQPLLDEELDFSVLQSRPQVTVEADLTDTLTTGFDQWYQQQAPLDSVSVDTESPEEREPTLSGESLKSEKKPCDEERKENGLVDC